MISMMRALFSSFNYQLYYSVYIFISFFWIKRNEAKKNHVKINPVVFSILRVNPNHGILIRPRICNKDEALNNYILLIY